MLKKLKNKIFAIFFNQIEIHRIRKERIEVNYLLQSFGKVGERFDIGKDYTIKNPQYIEIGNNFLSLDRFRIEAWDSYGNQNFLPQIIIGDNVVFNTDIHIGCINKIVIGDNCLFASR